MAATRIMMVAGEASGDMHGANLIGALRQLAPDLEVCGMGGSEMRSRGMEALYDADKIAVVGISEVLSHLQDIRTAMRTLEERLKTNPPHVLVLIDYPDFNLILAKRAKKLGIPIFYYISPQVWAWRSGRVRKIQRLVDRMAVILPFEQDFYARRGMEVEFVGHPLLDTVRTTQTRSEFLAKQGLEPNNTVIGLLPGSRKKEITTLLPVFLKAAEQLANEIPDPVFLLPLAPSLSREDLERNGISDCPCDIRILPENRYDLMAACQAVMTASGTATLELAILDVPMVVCYRISALTYFLGRRLIKVPYAALVNLVAERKIVPELLQKEATPEKIGDELRAILCDAEVHQRMRRDLAEVRRRLGGGGASEKTAGAILELAQRNKKG